MKTYLSLDNIQVFYIHLNRMFILNKNKKENDIYEK